MRELRDTPPGNCVDQIPNTYIQPNVDSANLLICELRVQLPNNLCMIHVFHFQVHGDNQRDQEKELRSVGSPENGL